MGATFVAWYLPPFGFFAELEEEGTIFIPMFQRKLHHTKNENLFVAEIYMLCTLFQRLTQIRRPECVGRSPRFSAPHNTDRFSCRAALG